MAIVRTPIVDDDGSGTTGTILNNAWKTELYNQIDALHADSPWVDFVPTFVTDTGAAITVTGLYCRYRKVGSNLVVWSLAANPMTLPAATNNIAIKTLPFVLASLQAIVPIAWAPSPARGAAVSGSELRVYRLDGANWAAGGAWVYLMTPVEVLP